MLATYLQIQKLLSRWLRKITNLWLTTSLKQRSFRLWNTETFPFFHVMDILKLTYVVMEYVAGKDLAMILNDKGYLKEDKFRPIFLQVVSAVHFLH